MHFYSNSKTSYDNLCDSLQVWLTRGGDSWAYPRLEITRSCKSTRYRTTYCYSLANKGFFSTQSIWHVSLNKIYQKKGFCVRCVSNWPFQYKMRYFWQVLDDSVSCRKRSEEDPLFLLVIGHWLNNINKFCKILSPERLCTWTGIQAQRHHLWSIVPAWILLHRLPKCTAFSPSRMDEMQPWSPFSPSFHLVIHHPLELVSRSGVHNAKN